MKKQLIICGITILLLMLGLSGCLNNSNDNSNKDKGNGQNSEVNLFIGKWKTIPHVVYANGSIFNESSSNSTFYNNGTMGSESVENKEIIWTPYTINNNQICLGEANASEYLCYNYEFSDNGTNAILVAEYTDPYSDSGDTIEIVIEMTKI
jgi:hypothetical protein